jgi:hypothetical protein
MISLAWPTPSIHISTNCKSFCRPNRTTRIERNKELEEGVFTATADPKKTSVPPPAEEVPPHLNFAPLQNASDCAHAQRGALPEGVGQSQQQRRTQSESG